MVRLSPISSCRRGPELCLPPAALCLSAETGIERVARQRHDLLPAQVHLAADGGEVGVGVCGVADGGMKTGPRKEISSRQTAAVAAPPDVEV